IRDHGHSHLIDALSHSPLVLQDEASPLPVQRAGYKFKRDICARTFDGCSGRQHLPLAGALEVAVELFVEKQPAKRPSCAVSLRLWRHFHIERSASSHGCLLLSRFASPFISTNTDGQAGECQSEKNYELFHAFLQSRKIIASLTPQVLKKRDMRTL